MISTPCQCVSQDPIIVYGSIDNEIRNKDERKTSNNVKSLPPVMFQTIPVALSIPISNKGDWIAFRAASLARLFPEWLQVA